MSWSGHHNTISEHLWSQTAKERSNYRTIALISHSSKVMLKILQARLQQYMNCELPDVQAGFRKDGGTRDQIANIRWIIKKAREFQKNIYWFMDYAKAFDYVDTTNYGKFFKRWEYQTTLPSSWEICVQVKKQQLEPYMEQQTGSKLGKEYIKAVYCHPAFFFFWRKEHNFIWKPSRWQAIAQPIILSGSESQFLL